MDVLNKVERCQSVFGRTKLKYRTPFLPSLILRLPRVPLPPFEQRFEECHPCLGMPRLGLFRLCRA